MFLQLDDGRFINLDCVIEVDPRLKRIKYINGLQANLSSEDTQKLLKTLSEAKTKPRKSRNTEKEVVAK